MRESTRGIIPNKVRNRKSFDDVGMDFQISINRLFEDEISDLITNKTGSINFYIDINYVKKVYDKYRNKKTIEEDEYWVLWYVYALHTWLENN